MLSEAAKEAETLYGEPALVAADNIDVVKVNKRFHLILNSHVLYQNIGREIVGFSQAAANNELMLRVTHKPFFYAGCFNHSRPGIYLHAFGTDKWQTNAGRSFPRYQSAIAAFAKNYEQPLWLASHELGHNFGLRHHDGVGPLPECIMSFNADAYCGPFKDKMMEGKLAR